MWNRVHYTCRLTSPGSGHDCVKSLQASCTELYPQKTRNMKIYYPQKQVCPNYGCECWDGFLASSTLAPTPRANIRPIAPNYNHQFRKPETCRNPKRFQVLGLPRKCIFTFGYIFGSGNVPPATKVMIHISKCEHALPEKNGCA